MGICPTCLNRKYDGAIYGDLTDKMLYEDEEIECFFVGNPRATPSSDLPLTQNGGLTGASVLASASFLMKPPSG